MVPSDPFCLINHSKTIQTVFRFPKSYLWSTSLVYKSRLELIILTIITKNYENRPNYHRKWSLVTLCCLLTQSKTIQIVPRSLNLMFEVHYKCIKVDWDLSFLLQKTTKIGQITLGNGPQWPLAACWINLKLIKCIVDCWILCLKFIISA